MCLPLLHWLHCLQSDMAVPTVTVALETRWPSRRDTLEAGDLGVTLPCPRWSWHLREGGVPMRTPVFPPRTGTSPRSPVPTHLRSRGQAIAEAKPPWALWRPSTLNPKCTWCEYLGGHVTLDGAPPPRLLSVHLISCLLVVKYIYHVAFCYFYHIVFHHLFCSSAHDIAFCKVWPATQSIMLSLFITWSISNVVFWKQVRYKSHTHKWMFV